jgi:FkbM family methyltransferase
VTFISYAQNFEDVMLWRALGHVQDGFYIDVGANDPVVDSVTQTFYERGWHGINIEPMAQYYEKLVQQRPRDLNLAVAVGERPGSLTFYDVPDTGLSTAAADIAQQHRQAGRRVVEQHIPVTTLSQLCEENAPADIHFLKVDVEGFELEVLRGMDFTRWRPWVLVVEATRPQSQESAHDEWEPLLLQHGYRFAWFDGLNRFYVSGEHAELLPAFALPPNYFDGFRLRKGHYYSFDGEDLEAAIAHARAGEASARAAAQAAHISARRSAHHAATAQKRVAELKEALDEAVATAQAHASAERERADAERRRAGELAQVEHELRSVRERLAHAEAENARLGRELWSMFGSRSWRLTYPLRWVGLQAALVRQQGLGERLRRLVRRLAGRRTAAPATGPAPAPAPAPAAAPVTEVQPANPPAMSRSALAVYEALRAASARPPTNEG